MSRLLTLANGERFLFAENVKFLFECSHLDFASPATVSRCSVVFFSEPVYRSVFRIASGYTLFAMSHFWVTVCSGR